MDTPTPIEAKTGVMSGYRLGSLFGIDIRAHVSVVIIFTIITMSLGRGLLPSWHPDWPGHWHWAAAIAAGLLFFASLLAHELAHALTARARGIRTSSITLFLFGGMAAIESEPHRPQDELVIAAAGPAMSLTLAALFLGAIAFTDPASGAAVSEAQFAASLSFVGTIALWLGSINLMLGLFNLIPGFPMDGGRLFRALLWWRTGDIVQATRVAARMGVYFGWLLMAYGFWITLQQRLLEGLWLLLIGWFISQLARASVKQLLLDRALAHTTVAAIMRTRFDTVPADTTLHTFLEDFVLRSHQQAWPVRTATVDVGYLCAKDLSNIGIERRAKLTVQDQMRQLDPEHLLTPETNAKEAWRQIAAASEPLPVVRAGRVVGLVDQLDILRWFNHLQSEHASGLADPF